MFKVRFYDDVKDELMQFAVIIAKYKGKWVFCKHKERQTYECPGGHREKGEGIAWTAKRELYEETGALEYDLNPVCVYSAQKYNEDGSTGREAYGMLYYAEIKSLGELPQNSEMERIELFTDLPSNWTHPEIQPLLVQKAALIVGEH